MKSILKPQAFPERIDGRRVYLKKHTADLAHEMFENVEAERGRLRDFLPWVDRTLSLHDQVQYVEKTHRWWQELTTFDYGIFAQSDDAYMGNAGVHTIDWNNEHVELGYVLWQLYEGKGYISEVVQLFEEVIFRTGFYRIEIRCDPRNVRSSAVALRNGYIQEGHLRSNSVIGGQRRDTLVFAKLRSEFTRSVKS